MARTVGLVIKKTSKKDETPKGKGTKTEEVKDETPIIEEIVEEVKDETPKGVESDVKVQE